MKRVLIITRDFPPYCKQSGWMIRMATLANYLVGKGYHVDVVATKRAQSYDRIQLNSKVNVFWVQNNLHYSLSTKLKFFHPSFLRYLLIRIFIQIRQGFVIDHDEPNIYQYKICIKKLLNTKEYETIVISAPPHSLFLLTPWLKKVFESAKILLDFRDAWSFRPMYRQKKESNQAKIERLETKIMKIADKNIFVSSGMEEIYIKKDSLSNTMVIENGYLQDQILEKAQPEIESFIAQHKKTSRLLMYYSGSGSIGDINSHKDLTRFLDVIKNDSYLNKRCATVVQGDLKISDYSYLDSLNILVLKSESLSKVHANMRLFDCGLTVLTDPLYYSPAVVTAKTYEYIYTDLQVIGIAPNNALSLDEIIKDIGGYKADVYDKKSISTCLKKVIDDLDSGKLSKPSMHSDIEKYSRSKMNKKFESIL